MKVSVKHLLPVLGALVLQSCVGCARPANYRYLEIHDVGPIRAHVGREVYCIVGTDDTETMMYRERARNGEIPKRSIGQFAGAQSERYVWSLSGDISSSGLLALGRRDPFCGGTEVYDLTSGKNIAGVPGRPLAVAWAPDGKRLAILDWVNPPTTVAELRSSSADDVRLKLWDENGGIVELCSIDFAPSTSAACYDQNRFAMSWNVSGSRLVASVRKCFRNNMKPECVLVDPARGAITSFGASDAYFIGENEIFCSMGGTWEGATIVSVHDRDITEKKKLKEQLFGAASDPVYGVFLAYRAPRTPFKRFALPLELRDVNGVKVEEVESGFAYGSCIRIVPVKEDAESALSKAFDQ